MREPIEFEVGKSILWEEVKVGEVFTINGCWVIAKKISVNEIFVLANDDDFHCRNIVGKVFKFTGEGWFFHFQECRTFMKFVWEVLKSDNLSKTFCGDIYRLPKEVQNIWRC